MNSSLQDFGPPLPPSPTPFHPLLPISREGYVINNTYYGIPTDWRQKGHKTSNPHVFLTAYVVIGFARVLGTISHSQ